MAPPPVQRPRSWIRPAIAWPESSDVILIRMPASGEEPFTLLRDGFMRFDLLPDSAEGNPEPSEADTMEESIFEVLGARHALLLLRAARRAEGPRWPFSGGLKDTDRLYLDGMVYLSESDEVAVLLRQSALIQRLIEIPDEVTTRADRDWAEFMAIDVQSRPSMIPPTIASLTSLLPTGVVAIAGGVSLGAGSDVAVLPAIQASRLEPPRDGRYLGIAITNALTSKEELLVTWTPRTDSRPSYPELRSAVERVEPAALLSPRRDDISNPHTGEIIVGDDPSIGVQDLENLDQATSATIAELWPPAGVAPEEAARRAEVGRRLIRIVGHDAYAWYQPFHVWNEETWGIYIDAEKLDSLAFSLEEDRAKKKVGRPVDSALLAVCLLYHHEHFHARVEAILTWLELTSGGPRDLRYKANVYRHYRGTNECLEEALANWWSRLAAEKMIAARYGTPDTVVELLDAVIDPHLDLSPAGYDQWRLGELRETWQRFSGELTRGEPGGQVLGGFLPLESLLRGDLPFDLLSSDIPTRFVGQGVIADAILSSPATFLSPSRKELQKALRDHYKYTVDTARGRGSHEFWKGKDNRGFTLPYENPVDPGIFRSFLHHFNITKGDYLKSVRPNI